MNYFFKKNAICERCSAFTSMFNSEKCIKCSNIYKERVLCKNCTIFVKKKQFLFNTKDPVCINCHENSGKRRSVSETSLSSTTPVELKAPPSIDYVDPVSRFAVPSKDVSLKALAGEDQKHAPIPLTSTKKVNF